MYRLYVDEVGTDDLTHVIKDKHRYLSLTGVAMKIDYARDVLSPNMNWMKSNVFNQGPDDAPIIFHRTDILGRKGAFGILRDPVKCDLFDRVIIRIMKASQYKCFTALIDKQWMLKQRHWTTNHPYHYLMEIIVEKYVHFLNRVESVGDIMPEARQAQKTNYYKKYLKK